MRRRRPRVLIPVAALLMAPSLGNAILSYSVTPGEVAFVGVASTDITVKNDGNETAPLLVSVADYSLTADGETAIGQPPPSRSARRWLRATPPKMTLRPGQSANVRVSSVPAKNATPGDHSALLLIGTDPKGGSGEVRVNTRIAVRVFIRVPGDIRRGVAVRRFAVMPHKEGRPPVLRLAVRNAGNIAEKFPRGRATVELWRGRQKLTTLRAKVRTVLPGTTATMDFTYRGRATGKLTAVVRLRPIPEVVPDPGTAQPRASVVRRYRVRI